MYIPIYTYTKLSYKIITVAASSNWKLFGKKIQKLDKDIFLVVYTLLQMVVYGRKLLKSKKHITQKIVQFLHCRTAYILDSRFDFSNVLWFLFYFVYFWSYKSNEADVIFIIKVSAKICNRPNIWKMLWVHLFSER